MKYLYTTIFVLLLLPTCAWATSAVIEVDTGGETINAIEGSLTLPSGMKVSDVYTGDSAILIWITTPKVIEGSREIFFAGLTPGGFVGKRPLFSISGDFLWSDANKITFGNVRALKSDGEGTEVKVRLSLENSIVVKDDVAPEIFVITLTKQIELHEGRFTAVFQTADKGSGVLRYEMAEKWFFAPRVTDWKQAESPLPINDSLRLKKLYVRALDHEGNYRVSSTPLPNRKFMLSFIVIILLVSCVFLIRLCRRQS